MADFATLVPGRARLAAKSTIRRCRDLSAGDHSLDRRRRLQRAQPAEDVPGEAQGRTAAYRGRAHGRGASRRALEVEHLDAAPEVRDVDAALVPVRRPGVRVVVDVVADLADVRRVAGVEEPHALLVERVRGDPVP